MMWRAIGSSGPAVEKVLPTLICVMQSWPLCSIRNSDGDNKEVFALAASLVVWVIVQVPECHEAMILYSSRLFVALLFHVVITTQHTPSEEGVDFWRACREEHRVPSNPNRFAVQTMKSLLFQLRCDNEVMAMERKHGWDGLLCAQTQHYTMGLLAREMRRVLIPLCSHIALHLLQLLSLEEPRWDLPFLAFFVEVLECLDFTKCGDSVHEIASRHLQSECRERRRLALRGLMVLSKDPLMARRICSLSQNLLELLGDADGDVVFMTLRVFTNLLQNKNILVSSSTAPKLAEALLPLFDHDNGHVEVLSLDLFFKVMQLSVDEAKKPLEKILSQSLLPLFLHCHDENRRVAKASRETLLRVTDFLKRRNLKQLVKKEQLLTFAKCLLQENRSQAAELLRQALPYLESPQEPLREAAIRFIGMAGQHLRGQQEELQLMCNALEHLTEDISTVVSDLALQTLYVLRALQSGRYSVFQRLQDQFRRAWKMRPHAAMDRTQEHKPARGRGRRSLKMFRKFVPIKHRRTNITATESPTEPDSRLIELHAEPDVSTDLAEQSENCDAGANDDRAMADMPMTEDVPITNTNTADTQGIAETETRPDLAGRSEDSDTTVNDDEAKADTAAVTEDVPITNTENGETQGTTTTDTTPSPTLSQELIWDYFQDPCVSSKQQVPAIVRNIHQRLTSHVTVGARLQMDILRLAEEHPADVVLTLLHCAPTCDRYRESSGLTAFRALALHSLCNGICQTG
ncbi:maestro heat-like repeat-containing protein family member 6 [Hirundo rustica]|uniref:maestro heat-like repeat-containing protein family member 6 n=1 Tax=Hirundo rustica TaxID=43150 RepID=UPI001A9416E6|nr:maestro heat-like repeat-containing protein family member 6 [Hirundo rustica]